MTLLRPSDVAVILQIDEATLRQWVAAGRFPAPVRIGSQKNLARWTREDVDNWRANELKWPAEDSLRGPLSASGT